MLTKLNPTIHGSQYNYEIFPLVFILKVRKQQYHLPNDYNFSLTHLLSTGVILPFRWHLGMPGCISGRYNKGKGLLASMGMLQCTRQPHNKEHPLLKKGANPSLNFEYVIFLAFFISHSLALLCDLFHS
jgi:hypothetical protein